MRKTSSKRYWTSTAGILAGSTMLFSALAGAAPALAQQAEEEVSDVDIIVTAQRRSERMQDVPIAVTPVTALTLENAAISGTLDLDAVVPGLVTYQIGTAMVPFIRGVGSNQSPAGFESSVAVYLDGVYIANKSSNVFDLGNIDRIEVLRGPQGTLFGRNATAGAVNIITRNPGSGPEFNAAFGYGDMDERAVRVYAGAPITETLSANVSFNGRWDEGYIWNPVRGVYQNPHESMTGSGVLLWEPTENFTARLSGNVTYYDQATFLSARPAPGTISTAQAAGALVGGERQSTSDHQTTARQEAYNVALNLSYDTPFGTLVSITGYSDGEAPSLSDSDFSNALTAYSGSLALGEQFTQEVQLQSPDNGGPLSWIVGAHYMTFVEGVGAPGENFISASNLPSPIRPQDVNVGPGYCTGGANPCATGISSSGVTHSIAAFAQSTYSLTEATDLTLGIRYGEESHSLKGFTYRYWPVTTPGAVGQPLYNGVTGGPGVVFGIQPVGAPVIAETDFDSTTYRLALSHDFTDDIMAYASFNTGFKSGGYNQTTLSSTLVNPEQLDAYELGIKTQWFNNRLRANAALWFYDYQDIQVGAITGVGLTVVQNAAAAELQGLDFDFEFRPTSNLTFRGGFTALESEYTEFTAAQTFLPRTTANTSCPLPVGGVGITYAAAQTRAAGTPIGGNYSCAVDMSGQRIIFAPEFSGNIGADLDIPLPNDSRVFLSGTLSYTSSHDVAPGGIFAEIPGYETLNGSATYYAPGDAWFVRVWGNNITDDLHPVYISPQALGFQYVENRPAAYGITFGVNFGQ